LKEGADDLVAEIDAPEISAEQDSQSLVSRLAELATSYQVDVHASEPRLVKKGRS
jgi:hypothetical protein